eukprot:7293439-Alexandrium_andersonii.AAC.1
MGGLTRANRNPPILHSKICMSQESRVLLAAAPPLRPSVLAPDAVSPWAPVSVWFKRTRRSQEALWPPAAALPL